MEFFAHYGTLLRLFAMAAVGVPGLYYLGELAGKLTARRTSEQAGMLVNKVIFYGGSTFIVVMTLNELGFKLQAILGAAGIAGVAIGFAAQTSLSNLISGLFLLSEGSVKVGEVITTGSTTGIVLSVDLLSVKLRTFDNSLVRIPNENIVKGQMVNLSRFAIRRMDLVVNVSYGADLAQVLAVLAEVADQNPACLDEPEPLIMVDNFGDHGITVQFGVWFAKEDFLTLRNSIMQDIKRAFAAHHIEFGFPQRSLAVSADAAPLNVRLLSPAEVAAQVAAGTLPPPAPAIPPEPPR